MLNSGIILKTSKESEFSEHSHCDPSLSSVRNLSNDEKRCQLRVARVLLVLGEEIVVFSVLLKCFGVPPLHVTEGLPRCLELIRPAHTEEDIGLELLVANDAKEWRLKQVFEHPKAKKQVKS